MIKASSINQAIQGSLKEPLMKKTSQVEPGRKPIGAEEADKRTGLQTILRKNKQSYLFSNHTRYRRCVNSELPIAHPMVLGQRKAIVFFWVLTSVLMHWCTRKLFSCREFPRIMVLRQTYSTFSTPVESKIRTHNGRVESARRRADGGVGRRWAEQGADISVALEANRPSGPPAQ